ncbi:MAG: cyclic peptide export ABC transporter [Pseudomonadota bacterium]
MASGFVDQSGAFLQFLLRDARVWRAPVVPLAILASAARTGMIFGINEIAEAGRMSLGMGAFLLASIAVSLIAAHIARVQTYVLVERIVLRLRRDLAERLLAADVAFFQARPHGEVFTALTSHAERVGEGIIQFARTLEAFSLFLFCVIYMFVQSWPSGAATLVTLLIGVACFFASDIAARKVLERAHRARVAMHETVHDMLGGYRELRLRRARRDAIETRADAVTEDVRAAVVESERLFSYGQLTASAALAGLLVAIVLILPPLVGAGSVAVLQVLTIVLFAFGPIEVVIGNLPAFGRASVAFEKLRAIMADADAREETAAAATTPVTGFREVRLAGVTATLNRPSGNSAATDTFTLGPIDLTLVPGQSVFITGGNGTGKSTLMQIITGLRAPDRGEILVDGVVVTDDTRADYRSLFSAVFSEFYIFRQLYGLSDSEKTALRTQIEALGLAEGVHIQDDAFASLELSTGQMRRLALSIALAEARPILVLDEFAADQDPMRRAYFYEVLVPKLAREGHCVMAVTHDEHCFDRADRLIKMESGKIVSDIETNAAANAAKARPGTAP